MNGASGVECGVWRGGVITPEAGYAGPRRQTFVEYPGGPPVWKRRALARFPPEDPEYVAAQCRVKAMPMDTQRDPGRSLFLLCLCLLSSQKCFSVTHTQTHKQTNTHTAMCICTPDCPRVTLAVMVRSVKSYFTCWLIFLDRRFHVKEN